MKQWISPAAHRLLALNLAMLLALTLAVPSVFAAAPIEKPDQVGKLCIGMEKEQPIMREEALQRLQKTEPEMQTQAAASSYTIIVGGTVVNSDTPEQGTGWNYIGFGWLLLDGAYGGQPISASGDLTIYSSGDVSVQGTGYSDSLGGDAIEVDGYLDLYIADGNLTCIGGTSYSTDWRGGDGIDANDGLSAVSWGGNLNATGGAAPNGRGGNGIYSYDGLVRLYSEWYSLEYWDDFACYAGREYPETQIEIQGGRGLEGGNGILAGAVNLDWNGSVTGGVGTRYADGPGVCCYGYSVGSYWNEDSGPMGTTVDLTVRAGSTGAAAIRTPEGMRSEQLLRDHIEIRERFGQYQRGTPYELQFYPASYETTFDGNGGITVPGAKTSYFEQYPCVIDLSEPRYTRDGYYLYGYYDATPDRLIMADDLYVPYTGGWLRAQWAPYDKDTVLFLANYGRVEGRDYAVRKADHTPFAVPAANTTHSMSDSLGWCTSGTPQWDEMTGALGTDEVWLDPGSEVEMGRQEILRAIWGNPAYGLLRYHGNGGTTQNGSTMSVKTTNSTGTDLQLYVGGNEQGFAQEGCRFIGWADAPENGRMLSANEFITAPKHLDVYAQWEKTTPHGTLGSTDVEWQLLTGPGGPIMKLAGSIPTGNRVAVASYDESGRMLNYRAVEKTTAKIYLSGRTKLCKLYLLSGAGRPLCAPERIPISS